MHNTTDFKVNFTNICLIDIGQLLHAAILCNSTPTISVLQFWRLIKAFYDRLCQISHCVPKYNSLKSGSLKAEFINHKTMPKIDNRKNSYQLLFP